MTSTLGNSVTYNGYWVENKKHGKGAISWSSTGKNAKGIWENNKLVRYVEDLQAFEQADGFIDRKNPSMHFVPVSDLEI